MASSDQGQGDHVKGAVTFRMPLHEVPKWPDLNSKVVPHHSVRWRFIGIELGLVPSVLDTIAENCAAKPQRSQECFNAVLEKWLMLDGPKATWNKLEHAITNVQRAELGLTPLEMRESSFTIEKEAMVNFTDCENVDECFSHFTAAMFKILSQAEFPLLRRACLENSNRLGGIALPKELKDSIMASQSLNNLFDVLCDSPYWNWMNIKLLVKMTRASHLDAASKLIQQYRDEVYSRKVMDVLQQIPKLTVSDQYYAKAKEKWNKNLDDVTVNDLVNHWSEVEQIFDVAEPTILLDRLVDGCVEIYWLIPTELIEHIRQSIQTKISMLRECDILCFDIEGHSYKSPSTVQLDKPITAAAAAAMKPKVKTASLSVSLLTLYDEPSETLCEKINSDLQKLGYRSQCINIHKLYWEFPPPFDPDAVILVVYGIRSIALPVIKELKESGTKKLFVICRSRWSYGDTVHICEHIFGSGDVVAIEFLEEDTEYKNCFDQLAASILKSLELKEGSFISEDIELVQESDSTLVYLIAEETEGHQYCQAIQQGADGNYKVALFADLRTPLPLNNAAIFKKVKAPAPLSFRLYNQSITGYVAAPTSHTQNCFTIVDSEEEGCVFIQDSMNKIQDTRSSLYMRVDEGNKIVATPEYEKGSIFKIRPINWTSLHTDNV